MKRSKFSEAQIAFVLKQADDGTSLGEVCRKAGISEAAYYNWRKKYAGLMPSEMKRLRQLEEENGKLKRLVADLSLDKHVLSLPRGAMLQDVVAESKTAKRSAANALRPNRRRQLVDDVRVTWQVSIRRACSVLRAERSSYHYRGKGTDQADLQQRIKEIAETRVRCGYRRIHVLLRREGWAINGKRVYRLYREMGLQLRKKAPKRRVNAKLREGRCAASRVNDVWAMDFVHDQLATGPKLRVLTVVDTFSRYSPAVVPRFRFRAPDVIDVLVAEGSLPIPLGAHRLAVRWLGRG